jgi:hypothetical protein
MSGNPVQLIDATEANLKEGMTVRVKDPNSFISEVAKKIADRDGVVLWVGPTPQNMHKGSAKVRFLKRNGRGKEFERIMGIRDLGIVPGAPGSDVLKP